MHDLYDYIYRVIQALKELAPIRERFSASLTAHASLFLLKEACEGECIFTDVESREALENHLRHHLPFFMATSITAPADSITCERLEDAGEEESSSQVRPMTQWCGCACQRSGLSSCCMLVPFCSCSRRV
jgi:hypothetical protein